MEHISRKMDDVAARPLKLNLQFFAEEEGYPNLEDSAEFKEDAREFNAKMDKYVQERESKTAKTETETPPAESKPENEPVKAEGEAEKPEVAVPEPKPKQDSETNKAFQEMRKKAEEAERAAKEAEDRIKRADALIAEQYGHMGIYTVEQYERAVRAEKEADDLKRYREAGLTQEEIDKLRKADEMERQMREQEETSKAQQEERAKQEHTQRWKQLYDVYPDLVESAKAFAEGGEPEWFNDEMKAEIARGASPLAAYRNAHFETILQKTLGSAKEQAKQEALDKLNSKDHLAPNAQTGGDVDHVEIDEQTMRMYRALNKGKSDAEIRKWHKKYAAGG